MAERQFRSDNHYTPCVYLKRFVDTDGRLSTYRTLVSRATVPLWKRNSAKSVGYLSHLYTRIAAGHETDEIERWLDHEFETPAAEPLEKATSGSKLTQNDWIHLIRFVAAQIVRTPAYFVKNVERWQRDASSLLDSTLQDSVKKLETAKASGQALEVSTLPYSDYLPLRVTAQIQPGQSMGHLKGTLLVGRGLWLFNIRHLLSGSLKVLNDHRWSILAPCEGLNWFTSDDPVIRLNYRSEGNYDFRGGCGVPGVEILLPLSPQHLLYTQIGNRPPARGDRLSREKTEEIRRLIAEHAHRLVFAKSQDEKIPTFRPRIVSEALFRSEEQQWRKWHAEQTAAEQRLMGATGTDL